MTIEQLTELFKWITVVNVVIFVLSSILVMTFKGVIEKIHGKMFGIDKNNISAIVYGYLGLFKVLIIVFNIGPYVALVLMQ